MSAEANETFGKRLVLEQLEERVAPAGNILAAVSGGNLVVTGDDADNDCVIDTEGLGAGQVRVGSESGTTMINGAAGPLILDGFTKGIRAVLGAGSDEITIDGVNVGGNVAIDGGEGDTSIEIGGTIDGGVTIKNGTGTRMIDIDAAIAKNVAITNGDGDNAVYLDGSVDGSVSIKNGNGMDTIVTYAVVGKNMAIANGSGGSSVEIHEGVGGNISVTALDGDDSLAVDDCEVSGKASFSGGSGTSSVSIANYSYVQKGASVTNQDGSDSFTVSQSHVLGGVKIANGEGDSNTLMSEADIAGAVSIKNGTGYDRMEAGLIDGEGGKWSIVNGEGGSYTGFDDVYVEKALSVTTGGGTDEFEAVNVTLAGAVTIKDSGGDSRIYIDDADLGTEGPDGGPQFSVTIQSGAGDHDIDIYNFDLGKDLKITNQGGTDLYIGDGWIFGGAKIVLGGENDSVLMNQGCEVHGAFALDLGAGSDHATIEDAEFYKAASIKLGDGNDTFDLEAHGASGGPESIFGGSTLISGGNGNDTFTIGVSGEDGNRCIFEGAVVYDGGADEDWLYLSDNNIFEGAHPVDNIEHEA